ncbi:hypothetical protein SAMN03159488_00939 [Pseudomonas sp. NFIX10]|uniref:hypothetical protein n=1 Tax=unclassified Pseudomonas TaxID=196821 RepID=UPI0008E0444D|nr:MULTISPECIES: hypothetical protein [unclassified Pseudomonas]SFA88917.1 hypothetical protein SAMN03159488_00939 [Pseudomonas sp. NFIX10]SFE23969.1 hypothetical protein SAMN03159367_00685 [Pseudomonas sp. NFACC06-1]
MKYSGQGLGFAVVCVWVAYAMLFFFATDGAVENPRDLNDTQGIPSVAMYLVILIVLMATSVALTGLGSVIQAFLKHQSFSLRMGLYVLTNTPLSLTSLMGALISVIYTYDTVSGVVATLLFSLSFALVLLAAPGRSK